MRFFASVPFSGAIATAVLAFAGMAAFLFLNTLYLQDVRGLTPLHAGLYLLPMAVMILIVAPLSGYVVGHRGSRLPMVLGGIALCAGALLLTRLTANTDVGYLLGAYVAFGIGMGWLNAPITNTAVSGMPPAQAGVAASIASTSRNVGLTLGVAIMGTIVGGAISGKISRSFAVDSHPAWYLSAAFAVVIIVLGLLTTTAWAERTAQRTADRFQEGRSAAAERGPHAAAEPVGS
jgi:MFS family permease